MSMDLVQFIYGTTSFFFKLIFSILWLLLWILLQIVVWYLKFHIVNSQQRKHAIQKVLFYNVQSLCSQYKIQSCIKYVYDFT